MKCNITQTTLGELSVGRRGYYGLGAPAVPYSPSLYTYLRITDINDDGTLNMSDLKSVSADNASDYLLKINDIVFARTGASTGRNYFYDGTDGDFVFAGFLIKFSLDPSKVNPRYVKYYCQSKEYRDWIAAFNTGSTRGNINTKTLASMPIRLPDMETQHRIVNILDALENKRKNNKQINDNLQQQVATIFKAWFVDFVPFDETMPFNWTVSTLGDVTEMGAGGDKPKETSQVKTPLYPYPIYSNGINNYGLYGYTNEPKIKSESVTVSARGTIGYVCLRHIPYVPIVRLVTLIPDTSVLSAKYLYLYLSQLHITGTGTTQQQLTVPDFRKTEIIIPDKATMDFFTETVTPLFEQIWVNEDENNKLAEVRDALLPKLMSGEIDVSNIQV